MAVARMAGQLVFASRPAGCTRDGARRTLTLPPSPVGTGNHSTNNHLRPVLLQLGMSLRLTASLCRLFGQQKKNGSTKGRAKQISKGARHKILHPRALPCYGRLPFNFRHPANRPARPHPAGNPLFQSRLVAHRRPVGQHRLGDSPFLRRRVADIGHFLCGRLAQPGHPSLLLQIRLSSGGAFRPY